MKTVKDVLQTQGDFTKGLKDRHKYVTREFQDFGYRIAAKLGETESVSLYIKLAKEKPRHLLEAAFRFAIDYPKARNRGKLFMWKLRELERKPDEKSESTDSDSKKDN